jgi:hypothetical protein
MTEWLKHNSPWLVPVVLGVLVNLANGLTNYPKAKNVLWFLVDLLSVVTKKDAPGTFKLPLARSVNPEKLQLPVA